MLCKIYIKNICEIIKIMYELRYVNDRRVYKKKNGTKIARCFGKACMGKKPCFQRIIDVPHHTASPLQTISSLITSENLPLDMTRGIMRVYIYIPWHTSIFIFALRRHPRLSYRR